MRRLLAGLALVMMPSLVHAQCVCTCVRGRSVPACGTNSIVQPICQQICTDKVEQSLGGSSIGGTGGSAGGANASAAASAAAAGIDPSVARAYLGR